MYRYTLIILFAISILLYAKAILNYFTPIPEKTFGGSVQEAVLGVSAVAIVLQLTHIVILIWNPGSIFEYPSRISLMVFVLVLSYLPIIWFFFS